MSMPAAERLSREALVIDGLTSYGDGDSAGFKAAGIALVNMTVSHFEADFETAFDQLAERRARLKAPDKPVAADRAGLRIAQLTYNQRNLASDGCLEAADSGVSAPGEQAVAVMNQLGIVVDLSHVGERACLRACEVSTTPALVTHATAKAIAW